MNEEMIQQDTIPVEPEKDTSVSPVTGDSLIIVWMLSSRCTHGESRVNIGPGDIPSVEGIAS